MINVDEYKDDLTTIDLGLKLFDLDLLVSVIWDRGESSLISFCLNGMICDQLEKPQNT